jgi:hypothetical protein
VLIPAIAGDVPDSGGRRKDAVYSLRSTRLTPIWVLLAVLVLAMLAASQIARSAAQSTGMVAAFVDANGNDIDDACEDPGTVVPDATAAADAEKAIDLDGDGTISVSEAAQSDRVGGENCNHGGYVSWVAHGACPDAAPAEPVTEPVTGPALDPAPVVAEACADESTAEQPTDETTAAETDCVEIPPPDRDPALDDQKNGHGKWVSSVARSEARGGKNCNRGGAVSEAAKKDHDAAKAARDRAKAARDAAKSERAAARAAAKAERQAAREAAKGAKGQGKGKNGNR